MGNAGRRKRTIKPDVSRNYIDLVGDYGDGAFYVECEHMKYPYVTHISVDSVDREVICPDCGEVWLIMQETRIVSIALRQNQRTQKEADSE